MKRYIKEPSIEIENYIVNEIKKNAFHLETEEDLDPLMEKIGDARYVLLGEASHGTHEYYTWRAKISQRLIKEKGFSFIAVEGDWPDCYRLNRYIKGYSDAGENALEVLHQFNRWPTWMWANWEVEALAEWLRKFNSEMSVDKKIGFYGLDVYSLGESLEAILNYLKKIDPHAYETAQKAAACFEPFGYEGQEYGHKANLSPVSCEGEVIDLLKEIRHNVANYNHDFETAFSTEQNALVALHAENYYRAMVKGGPSSWNIRDTHMVETLDRLVNFHGPDSKVIVWEHNTHIGDARATDMKNDGMVNVGELVTEMHKHQGVVKVGFGSYKGSVIAGHKWGDVMRSMEVPEGMKGSWEELLHTAGANDKLLLMDKWNNDPLFKDPIGHRAIGVVYNSQYEKYGNYVPSVLPDRYDAFIFIDETKALHPIQIKPNGLQIPETYPWGM